MVVSALRSQYKNVAVVIESPVSRFNILKRRIKHQGTLKVIFQFLFIALLPIMRIFKKRVIARILNGSNLNSHYPKDLQVKRVPSANSIQCQNILKTYKPDLIVINGTRILSKDTLESCSAVFLNIHCGITPAYRGVHGAYWALVCSDPNNLGVTIHTVDSGVDTGDIVYQETINVEHHDNFVTYPYKQFVIGIPLLLRAISDFELGRLKKYRRDNTPSNIWYHPTLYSYIWNRLLRNIR